MNKTFNMVKRLLTAISVFIVSSSYGQLNQPNNLPNSFSMVAHEYDLGWCTFEFYKYNVRTPDFEVWDWDMTGLTAKSVPEIRTFRGRIVEHPNWKLFAVWYDDNTISIKGLMGKGMRNAHFDINGYAMDTVEIGSTSLQPSLSNQASEVLLTTGHTPTYNYLHSPNAKGPQGSWETCVAMFEHVINVADWHLSRDVGISQQIGLVVIPTNPAIGNNFINPLNYSNQLNEINCWWRTKGYSGGGTGMKWFNNAFWHKGMIGMTRTGSGAFSHEFTHQLDCGHYHNQKDTQHSNHYYMGRNTVAISKDHLDHPDNSSIINSIPNYSDPMHPWCAQDYVHAEMNNSILIDVLENDIDYNYDTITLLNCDANSEHGGTLTISANKIIYQPPNGYVGNDKFSYTAQSGSGNGYFINSAEVHVEVQNPLCHLALRYSFDNLTSSVIPDVAWGVSSHNAMLHFANYSDVLESGVHGEALNLDGNTSLRTDDILNPLDQSMSISIWFKPDSIDTGDIGLIYDSGAKGKGSHAGISIALLPDSTIEFIAQPEAKDRYGVILRSIHPVNFGQWNHAVMVIDRIDHELKAYLNNNELTYVPNFGFNDKYFNANHIIKGYPGLDRGSSQERVATCFGHSTREQLNAANLSPYYGAIDEFRIYTKALSSSEVAILYNDPIDMTVGACVTSTINYFDTRVACDSLTWIDGITYHNSNNTATQNFITPLGLDSIVHLDLTINETPIISIDSDIEECYPYEFIPNAITNIGGITWSDGLINGEAVIPEVGVNTYFVEANNHGCIASDSIIIEIHEYPSIDAGDNIEACFPYEFVPNAVTNIGSISWSDGLINNDPISLSVGDYTFLVTANNEGCSSVDSLNVVIHNCTCTEEHFTESSISFEVYDITGRLLNKNRLPKNQILIVVHHNGQTEKIYLSHIE